jgi:hypothetical protein
MKFPSANGLFGHANLTQAAVELVAFSWFPRIKQWLPPTSGTGRPFPEENSFPQFQLLGHCLIPFGIGLVEVIEQTAALANHHKQTSA